MLEKVHVENFQSIADAELELGPVTMLVGPGNAGKSAILRAVLAALTNDANDDVIRHGAKKAQVTLTIDGEDLAWSKVAGKGGVYQWRGQDYSRTKGQLPEPIADWLAVREVEIDSSTSLLPQIHKQHDAPFLISESGSRVARILGKLTKLDTVVSAQMKCRNEIQQHHRDEKSADTEIERLNEKLETLPDVGSLRGTVDQLERTLQESHKLAGQLAQAQAAHRQLLAAKAAFDPSGLLADLELVDKSLSLLTEMDTAYHQCERAQRLVWDTEKDLEQATAKAQEAQAGYDIACADAGLTAEICEDCPLRV